MLFFGFAKSRKLSTITNTPKKTDIKTDPQNKSKWWETPSWCMLAQKHGKQPKSNEKDQNMGKSPKWIQKIWFISFFSCWNPCFQVAVPCPSLVGLLGDPNHSSLQLDRLTGRNWVFIAQWRWGSFKMLRWYGGFWNQQKWRFGTMDFVIFSKMEFVFVEVL